MLPDRRLQAGPPQSVKKSVPMPTFLIVGAGKSGTTSLYEYLKQHPQVFMPEVKEPLFFAFEGQQVKFSGPGDAEMNARAVTTLERYHALFRDGMNQAARGEASTAYLYYPAAAQRIRRLIPEAKLVILLRCPAERAYSNFLHALRVGREPIGDFAKALDAEPKRISAGWSHFFHYRSKGWYYRQLTHWINLFPRDQLLIHLYDDLENDPTGLLRGIFNFIGVDPDQKVDMTLKFNASGMPIWPWLRNCLQPGSALARAALPKPIREGIKNILQRSGHVPLKIPAETREEMMHAYAPDVVQLSELMKRNLSHWLDQRFPSCKMASA